MKRIILVVLVAALVIPAAASARTPVSGGPKQAIVQSFVQSNQSIHLHVTSHQIAGCFDAYTDGSYAYVTINGARFTGAGLCDIKDVIGGQVAGWQPASGLLRHEARSWRALLTFDQIELSQLRQLGIPLPVFENLANAKPPNYPFVP